MKNSNFKKIEVVVFAIILIGTLIIVPSTAVKIKVKPNTVTVWENKTTENTFDEPDNNKIPVFSLTTHPDKPIAPDTYYVPEQEVFAGEQNDVGYNTDAGGNILKSLPLYVGEPVDETIPGRGRTGSLGNGDGEDWYRFSVCQGQTITATVSSGFSFELKEQNLLNDKKFADLWIKEKIQRHPSGRLLIFKQLTERGVRREIIEETLEKLLPLSKEIKLAKEVLMKKKKTLKRENLSPNKLYQKLAIFLKGKGFTGEAVGEVLERE